MNLAAFRFLETETANAIEIPKLVSQFKSRSVADVFGEPGATFWLDEFHEWESALFTVTLRMEYLLERDSLDKERVVTSRALDLVESRFVLFDIGKGIFIVDDRQFRDRGNLTKARMLGCLADLLSDILPEVGVAAAPIVPVTIGVTKQRMLEFFNTEQVIELTVTGLADQVLPDSVVVYNPNFDKNLALREIIRENTIDGLVDEVTLKAGSPDANLHNSTLAKGFAQTGVPKSIEFQREPDVEHVERRIVTLSEQKAVEIEIPYEPNPHSDEFVRRVLDLVAERMNSDDPSRQVSYRVRVVPKDMFQ